ncbi:hypothetical protein TO66_19525 [Pseudomonas sp. MRSN 12121]|nr:hypothetical protein TO66_19525 [Pseudomonas sp. MRSN 12121]
MAQALRVEAIAGKPRSYRYRNRAAPVGAQLARDEGNAMDQALRVEAIAGKPRSYTSGRRSDLRAMNDNAVGQTCRVTG